MKKIVMIFSIVALLAVGLVVAHGLKSSGKFKGSGCGVGCGMHDGNHEEMMQVMESGSYEDFIILREQLGKDIMPWVESSSDFEAMQKMHRQKHKMHKSGGHSCPMMG